MDKVLGNKFLGRVLRSIPVRAFFQRLKITRQDELGREQGQSLVRVVLWACSLIYLVIVQWPAFRRAGLPPWLLYWLGYGVLACVITWLAFRDTRSSLLRRYGMNLGDTVIITYGMVVMKDAGIPLFTLYLWGTLGQGFRYGVMPMAVSTIISLIGFAVVVWLTPVWHAQPMFVASVMFALIILPLYGAHLIRMLNRALGGMARSRFLARANEELQAPLKNVLSAAEQLTSSRSLAPHERALLADIRDAANLSLRQIGNVLDFSRLEAGDVVLKLAPCDLHEIIHGALETLRPQAHKQNVRILLRANPDTPYLLIGDARCLGELLLHVVGGAVKFTHEGFVYVDITAREDTAARAILRVELRNTGRGFHAQWLAQAGPGGMAEREHGNELGMGIAKQLVALMGGRMGIEGEALWFEITLAKQAEVTQVPTALPGVRALLLSEEPATTAHFQNALTEMQGSVVTVNSAKDALEALTRSIRLGNLMQVLLIDVGTALGRDGNHRLGELCDKAIATNVFTVLITDIAPAADRLRTWGYNALLSRRADAAQMGAALRPAALGKNGDQQSVVNVPPWLWSRRETRRPRILVADDNRTNLMIVRRMLEQAGYEVEEQQTGKAALDSLCSGIYRLAILDMHMPDLSGTDVLRQYRTRCPRSRLPTIILTANVSVEAQQRSADAGADAYLSKPVTAANLLHEVERLIRDSQVETLPPAADTEATHNEAEEVILETEVLAELDRLYRDPRGLAQIIEVYQHEGGELLQKIAEACDARDNAAFSEWMHALKGNGANVGAVRLVRLCHEGERMGVMEFRRRRELLTALEAGFAESLSALHDIVPGPQQYSD